MVHPPGFEPLLNESGEVETSRVNVSQHETRQQVKGISNFKSSESSRDAKSQGETDPWCIYGAHFPDGIIPDDLGHLASLWSKLPEDVKQRIIKLAESS